MGIDLQATALCLLDVQEGLLQRALAPRPGAVVVSACAQAAAIVRARNVWTVAVLTQWQDDLSDLPPCAVDRPMPVCSAPPPPSWSDLAKGLEAQVDAVIHKRQWGAFYGTDLELQLRRRGIRTLLLAGAATNFAIESTARQAWELGFSIVFLEDATTGIDAQLHAFSFREILPRLGKVSSCSALADYT